MTELSLILAIVLAGLTASTVLARWVRDQDAGSSAARRLGGALERTAESLLGRQARLAAIPVGATAASVALLHLGTARLTGRAPDTGVAATLVLGVVFGAVAALGVAWLAAVVGLRASTRFERASATSAERGFSVAMRAGGSAGLAADSLSILGVAAAFGLAYSIRGGFAPGGAAVPLRDVVAPLPGFALGAAVAALVLQSVGSRYLAAAVAGADGADGRGSGVFPGDPRSPATITAAVAGPVGRTVGCALDAFVASSATCALAAALGTSVVEATSPAAPHPLAVVLFPLVVRAFGVLAAAFGLHSVRLGPRDAVGVALLRGRLTTVTVALGGVTGAAIWLLGNLWIAFSVAGAVGLVVGLLATNAVRIGEGRGTGAGRAIVEAARPGVPTAAAQGLGAGLERTLVPAAIFGVAMVAVWLVGDGTGLPHGGSLAVAVALTAMLSEAGYMVAAGAFATVAQGAESVSGLDGAPPTAGPARRMDEARFGVEATCDAYFALAGLGLAVIVASTLPLVSGRGAPSTLDLTTPMSAWAAALGGVAVAYFSGRALRHSADAAQAVALDVERQLRGFPRESGVVSVPGDFAPSYRSTAEVAARSALARVAALATSVSVVPAALILGLGGAPGLEGSGAATSALAAFVLSASVVGAVFGLGGAAAHALIASARRAVGRSGGPGQAALADADALGALVAGATATSVPVARTFAIACLAMASYLG